MHNKLNQAAQQGTCSKTSFQVNIKLPGDNFQDMYLCPFMAGYTGRYTVKMEKSSKNMVH